MTAIAQVGKVGPRNISGAVLSNLSTLNFFVCTSQVQKQGEIIEPGPWLWIVDLGAIQAKRKAAPDPTTHSNGSRRPSTLMHPAG